MDIAAAIFELELGTPMFVDPLEQRRLSDDRFNRTLIFRRQAMVKPAGRLGKITVSPAFKRLAISDRILNQSLGKIAGTPARYSR
jgi:hypothetical protein